MPDVAQLLESLHPMREPPPPSPVAPFLTTLAVGVAVAALIFVLWRLARQRSIGMRRSAARALVATRNFDPDERLAAQATLLRQVVRIRAGESAARTQGDGWLATLDRTFATSFFTAGAGRAYADSLYRRDGAEDVEALDRSLSDLIARLGTGSRKEVDA